MRKGRRARISQTGLSLGSLLQARQIAALCDEGATSYDLGMDMPYKRRWAEHAFDTITIAITPGP
jgi:CelD/BcsL family acetyltransferase involved in cellulose biosynthesis